MSGEFALFAGSDYYPDGGWIDFVSHHDTQAEAVAAAYAYRAKSEADLEEIDWWHVVHLPQHLVVADWTRT